MNHGTTAARLSYYAPSDSKPRTVSIYSKSSPCRSPLQTLWSKPLSSLFLSSQYLIQPWRQDGPASFSESQRWLISYLHLILSIQYIRLFLVYPIHLYIYIFHVLPSSRIRINIRINIRIPLSLSKWSGLFLLLFFIVYVASYVPNHIQHIRFHSPLILVIHYAMCP